MKLSQCPTLCLPLVALFLSTGRLPADDGPPIETPHEDAVTDVSFAQDVLPILREHCFACHGPDDQQGNVRFDQLSTDLVSDSAAAETWKDALDLLNLGEMPPVDQPELPADARTVLVAWITDQVDQAIQAHRSTGGQTVLRRLNRSEYQNTMRDLLGIDLDYADRLPPDEVSEDGFRNNGRALRMSPMQLEAYLDSARRGLSLALVDYERPDVIEHHAVESEQDKGQGNWTNRLGRSGVFVARSLDFPSEGEFRIRVRARAEVPPQSPFPRMRVTLGYRADTLTPSREVGIVDVTSEASMDYEFRGRIEEFPLQSRTQSKYPGLLIWIDNVLRDGQRAAPPRTIEHVIEVNGKTKKTKTLVWDEDPAFPKIIIEAVEFHAPLFQTWPPPHHTRIIPRQPIDRQDEIAVARQSLRRFMRRAFRRPPSKAWVRTALKTFVDVRVSSDSFIAAMRETLAMILVTPEFLYLVEPAVSEQTLTKNPAKLPLQERELDDYQIASRLSYFLWSSMPDDRLLKLAGKGKLADPVVRAAQVDRMLADEKSWSMIEQFSSQWLGLDRVDRVAVNPEFYPDFDSALKADMRRETQHFFAEILHRNQSALNFIDSDFLMLNHALATHYGISARDRSETTSSIHLAPGPVQRESLGEVLREGTGKREVNPERYLSDDSIPRSSRFQRVALPAGSGRGGLLTQASILLAGSNGEASHPILRGVWLRDRLLGDPPAPPPPNVPNLDADDTSLASLSLKERLVQHRENEACANCHRGIDPWGIALEHFDAVGAYRDEIAIKSDGGGQTSAVPVDAQAQLPRGQTIHGHAELKKYLLDQESDRFASSLVKRLLSYALGRSIEFTDGPTIDRLSDQFRRDNYRLKSLVRHVVGSDVFATR